MAIQEFLQSIPQIYRRHIAKRFTRSSKIGTRMARVASSPGPVLGRCGTTQQIIKGRDQFIDGNANSCSNVEDGSLKSPFDTQSVQTRFDDIRDMNEIPRLASVTLNHRLPSLQHTLNKQ